MKALADSSDDRRPVERWHPENCGEIDIIIKSDGSWWHEGSLIKRKGMVELFASVLRKDEDGITYLVTPVEKLSITVERGHFVAVRLDAKGEGEDQRSSSRQIWAMSSKSAMRRRCVLRRMRDRRARSLCRRLGPSRSVTVAARVL